jgi:hypothetical protein
MTTQPGWGQPGYQPPPEQKKPIWKRTWFIVTAAVAALGLAGLVVLGTLVAAVDTGTSRAAHPAATTIDPPVEEPTQDTEATETPETTEAPSGPPVVRVGDTLEMTDGFGDTVAEVTVGGPTSPSKHKGVRFSTGGEYDEPTHGLYLGVWVKVKALQDGVETVYGDLHVVQGGKHYPGDACCPDGFKPTLDYATLSKGEVSEGWVIFDLRSRKGEVVIANYDGKRLGAWKF